MTTTANPNPANPHEDVAPQRSARRRIPMSIPRRKLETTDIPGFHQHWFVEENIERAIQAGYTFVDDKEVTVTQSGVGNSLELSGNQDLGSRVRVVAGLGRDGKGSYLTLMKLKEEFRREDQVMIEERNASVLQQIFRGEMIYGTENESQSDRNLRYVDREKTTLQKALFQRPTRKSKS